MFGISYPLTHRLVCAVRWAVLILFGVLYIFATGFGAVAAPPVELGKSGGPSDKADPPLVVTKQGYFYVGGAYDNPQNPTQMTGQMYVEYQLPAKQSGRG